MFEGLMPLLTERQLVVTLSRVGADEICINVIPKLLKSDQQDVAAALNTPLSLFDLNRRTMYESAPSSSEVLHS